MTRRDDLLTLFDYNTYANRLVLDTAARMTTGELARSVSPSHGNVGTLLRHMLEADAWMVALARDAPWQELPALSTLAELRQYWEGVAADLRGHIAALPDDGLERAVPVQFGEHRLTYTVWQMLMQTFQHATHHRGELSATMTSLGYPLPTLDIMLFFTDRSGQHRPFGL